MHRVLLKLCWVVGIWLLLSTMVVMADEQTQLMAYHQLSFSEPLGKTPAGAATDFTPHGTQPGLNFGLMPAQNCANCHAGFSPPDSDNLPVPTWAGSMMANATRDPLFWAALDVANNDVPGVGDFCLRCHTNRGWYRGNAAKKTNGSIDPFGATGCQLQGALDAADNGINDYSGVTCHFCHRVEQTGPQGQALMTNNANTWVDDQACVNGGNGPCRKGPYNYPDGTYSGPPHEWAYSEFIQTGQFCGACHNVSSPDTSNGFAKTLIDTDGTDTGLAMPIERTYDEWLNSRFGDLIFRDSLGESLVTDDIPAIAETESCQSCHMDNSTDVLARACSIRDQGSRAGNLPIHQFAGGNAWMPAVLKSAYGAALGREAAFDRTQLYALDMLQNRSALVETQLNGVSNGIAQVQVKVTNLTGHKLPTGYPEGRRMWLNVQARDANNNLIWESGAYDPATAVLTHDSQIKIYETLQGIWDGSQCVTEEPGGRKLFHFMLNNCVAKDNRIPPLGFISNIEMKPVAYSYPANPQHSAELVNWDITNYSIPLNGATLPVIVTATLNYQTASKEYIDFLATEAVNNNLPSENALCNRNLTVGPANQTRGAYMQSLWQNNGRSAPVAMGVSQVTVN